VPNHITRLKNRLSRVKEDSVHYSVTSFFWEKSLKSGKLHACKYWWILFPTSLIFAVIVFIVAVVVAVFGIFIGRLPNFDADEKNQQPFFSPHRRRANGQPWPRFIPAPYQIVLPILTVTTLYWLITEYTYDTIFVSICILVMIPLGGVLMLISKNWDQPALKGPREVAIRSIDSGWNKACPLLTIVPKPSEPEPESSDSTA